MKSIKNAEILKKEPHKKPQHPPYPSMIKKYLKTTPEGASIGEIQIHIKKNYTVPNNFENTIKLCIEREVDRCNIIKTKTKYSLKKKPLKEKIPIEIPIYPKAVIRSTFSGSDISYSSDDEEEID